MLTELLVHVLQWDAVWYAHPGGCLPRLGRHWGGRWHAGVWTGLDGDLICVRRCDTKGQAEKHLSPGSRTVLGAVLKAAWKRYRLSSNRPSHTRLPEEPQND
jgi:hypothetical protein